MFLLSQAIYQLFYRESSSCDRGSMYQLRNLINRRDVTGPKEVKEKFRFEHFMIVDFKWTCWSNFLENYSLIFVILNVYLCSHRNKDVLKANFIFTVDATSYLLSHTCYMIFTSNLMPANFEHTFLFVYFRPHVQFLEDVTDAYLVSACLDLLDMDDMTSKPKTMPVMSLITDEDKTKWLYGVSEELVDKLGIMCVDSVIQLRHDLSALDRDNQLLEAMKVDQSFMCAICGKQYSSKNWLRRHLLKTHKWKFHASNQDVSESGPVQTFLFMSLVFRDLCDSYRLGDGDRILRNAYFEWLFDSALKHSKYKIWLWRMITYCTTSVIGYKKSLEYKWNMCVNLKGGINNNIPNDNCVELQVKNIKSQLNTQGVNKSFNSARTVCLTTQVVHGVKENLLRTTHVVKSKRHRPEVVKANDISTMVKCIRDQGPVGDLVWASFRSFRDPLQCIDADDLHNWITKQKQLAAIYM